MPHHGELTGPLYQRYIKGIFEGNLSSTTFVTDRVYLLPIQILFPMAVDRCILQYAAIAAGNIRAGIYRDNGDTPVGGALIVESAGIPKIGINQKHEVPIADTILLPGLYWMAFVSDENLSTYWLVQPVWRSGGTLTSHEYALGAFGPLDDPCPATATEGNVPYCALRRMV